jgi:hypothetical protein
MFVLHTYIPLQCAVPPGEPLILEEDGDPVQGNTVGPYREGAVVALDCVVYGGIYILPALAAYVYYCIFRYSIMARLYMYRNLRRIS